MLRLLRVPEVKRAAVTVEEIKVLLEQSATEGVLEPGEREMMTNVLNLDERHVAGVLTPRSDVVFLDVRDSVDVSRGKMRQESHDILPVCDGGLDHVLGVVRARRVLEEVLGGHAVDLSTLVEPALFVPETMTVMRLLEEFKRKNLSAALVVDEFGEVQGIVSLTDVVTSIVGDLPVDQRDEPMIVRRDDGSWLLDGTLDLATLMGRWVTTPSSRQRTASITTRSAGSLWPRWAVSRKPAMFSTAGIIGSKLSIWTATAWIAC